MREDETGGKVPFYRQRWVQILGGVLVLIVAFGLIVSDKLDNQVGSKESTSAASEVKYLNSLLDDNSILMDSFAEAQRLFRNPTFTEQWTYDLALSLVSIEDVADRGIAEKNIPKKYKELHKTRIKALYELKDFVKYTVDGIDSLNVEKINKGGASMRKATEYMTEMNEILDSL